MKPITFGSVCSGIEAASVAWAPLGWKAAWLSEIELFPCQLLAYRFPSVPNLGDMREIPRLLRSGLIPAPDVFTGGTPCQAFSIAGLRNSLGDARGNLSMTFCEIANEIDIQRAANGLLPCVIKWENVPGVLSTKDNAFGCFLAGLAGEDETLVPEPCPAAGKSSTFWKWDKKAGTHSLSWPKSGAVVGPQRTVCWRTLDAQFFGVAQRRRRVFVVASACEGFDPAAILLEFDGVRRDSPPSRSTPQDIAAGTLRSTDGGSDIDQARAGHIQPVAFGGNRTSGPIDVSPALLSHSGSKLDFESETFMVQQVAGTLTASYGDQCGRDLAEMPGGLQVAPIAFDSRQSPVSSYEVFGSLGSSSPQAQAVTYAIQAGALRTNPASGPDGVGVQTDIGYTLEARAEVQAVAHTLDASSGRSRGAGTPVGMLAPVCITGDITHTLKAEGFDASEDGTGRGQPIISVNALYGEDLARTLTAGAGKNSGISSGARDEPLQNGVMSGMAVRRLMPVECERLQGFPDGWTDIPLPGRRASDKPARMAADGPRYKALGNSWAVPNVYWIGKRIHDQLMKLEIA